MVVQIQGNIDEIDDSASEGRPKWGKLRCLHNDLFTSDVMNILCWLLRL
jgi:hypothetical protein